MNNIVKKDSEKHICSWILIILEIQSLSKLLSEPIDVSKPKWELCQQRMLLSRLKKMVLSARWGLFSISSGMGGFSWFRVECYGRKCVRKIVMRRNVWCYVLKCGMNDCEKQREGKFNREKRKRRNEEVHGNCQCEEDQEQYILIILWKINKARWVVINIVTYQTFFIYGMDIYISWWINWDCTGFHFMSISFMHR